ncbi:MAG: hypothetical protein H5U40_04900, partial [Polyangiaceae bacterium]|nr:hypothetical protein [Polyangiaceae bacterium]
WRERSCADPDECDDGAERFGACEGSDLAARPEVCVEGAWSATGPCEAVSISAGFYHTCAARAEGNALCWGRNYEGQIGNSDRGYGNTELEPVSVHPANWIRPYCPTGDCPFEIEDVVAITAGGYHACAVQRIAGDDSRVLCWGERLYGQIGDGQVMLGGQEWPEYVRGLTYVEAIDAGGWHTCALRRNGAVRCWGHGGSGRLGDGYEENRIEPVAVVGLDDATAIAAGNEHSCALRATGEVACWGSNAQGQLGDGLGGEGVYETTPVAVAGVTDAVALDAGGFHTCALRATGGVVCWGAGSQGRLGNGGAANALEPVAVTGLEDAKAIALGSTHACAIREGGALVCWGLNDRGQLGSEAGEVATVPAPVEGLEGVVGVVAGLAHTCALGATGEPFCWGRGDFGQLGYGDIEDSATPIAVAWPR